MIFGYLISKDRNTYRWNIAQYICEGSKNLCDQEAISGSSFVFQVELGVESQAAIGFHLDLVGSFHGEVGGAVIEEISEQWLRRGKDRCGDG